jgi:hypothetical protein
MVVGLIFPRTAISGNGLSHFVVGCNSLVWQHFGDICMIPVSTLTQASLIVSNGSLHWLKHFRTNRDRLLSIPWDSAYSLSKAEIRLISHSIQTFQLGESSEGTHLMKVSR